jgi:small subunit ribosomal protein S7e
MISAKTKIQKPNNAAPTAFEETVAQAIFDIQSNTDLKNELADLKIASAVEIDVPSNRKAVLISVPYRMIQNYRRIQSRLVRELEKKFGNKHVVIIGQRKIIPRPDVSRKPQAQKRPRSRTLTAVHTAYLEDLVFPTEIVGKRTRVRVDGSKTLKVYALPTPPHPLRRLTLLQVP